MSKFPALYKATLYIFEEDNKTHRYEICGILYADSFADAARQIEEYYGDELGDIKIELYEEGLIEFAPSKLPEVQKILDNYLSSGIAEEVKNVSTKMW